MARSTAAGSLAHGVRRVTAEPLTVAGQRRSRTDFPRPGPEPKDRTQHPGCAQPLSREHPRDVTSTAQTLGAATDRRPADRQPSGVAAPATWHAGVWLVWALSAAACIELAPSPVYVALVIGIAALAVSVHARPGPYRARVPDPDRGRSAVRRGAHAPHRRDHPRARSGVVHDAPLRAPAAARRLHRRRNGRAPGRPPVARRGIRHRRRDGGVRRLQRGRLPLGARAVDPPGLLRGRAGGRGRARVRAVDALVHSRRARRRPRPHRRPRRAPGPAAAPDRARARVGARAGGHPRRVDGRARLRARRRRAARQGRRLVGRRRPCSRSAARSSR